MRCIGWEERIVQFRLLLWLGLFLLPQQFAIAERLPIKTYTTEDGLNRNLIRQILQDSKGYLWLVTPSGLSRYDGYEFKNYAVGQSKLMSLFWRMIEDRNGGYWLATAGGGLYKFRPEATSKDPASGFEYYPLGANSRTDFVHIIFQDRAGRVWCGANGGLFCLDEEKGEREFRSIDIGLNAEEKSSVAVISVLEDQEGNLWLATNLGLICGLPDGRMVRYRLPTLDAAVGHIFSDRSGRIWMEHSSGLLVFRPEAIAAIKGDVSLRFLPQNPQPKQRSDKALRLPSLPGEASRFTEADGFVGKDITAICQAYDGDLWFGMYDKGLLRFDGKRFRLYAKEEGLSHYKVRSLAEDNEGNLWIGTDGGGLMKKVKGGFTSFTAADGIDETVIAFMMEDPQGSISVATDLQRFNRFDGERFHLLKGAGLDKLMKNVASDNLHFYYTSPALRDHANELWFATGDGLYRFPALQRIEQLATTPPIALYKTTDGLPSNNIYTIFEDSRGDLWISFLDLQGRLLCKWDRATNTFHSFGKEEGLSISEIITSITEDRQGNIWFGLGDRASRGGMIGRYDGRHFRMFSKEDGVPEGSIRDLFVDSQGRLWIASSRGGLGRVDDPVSQHPAFSRYTIADGLSDNEINCVAEDQWRNIYAGMGRGLDCIDSASGRIRHYTGGAGLTGDDVRKIFRDSRMSFWIGTTKGLFHFTPEPESPKPAPPIFITELIIAGEEQQIAESGERQIAELQLHNDRNNLQIGFVSPNVGFATTIRYEYKLEGANQEWSPVTELRAVYLANLSSGRYRFLVRAISSDGTFSTEPATVSFRILPPIWLRWWFLTFSAIFLSALAANVYRLRKARRRERERAEAALRQSQDERLRELEQVRRRIATDLHDDVGSSLTQISLLSEVVRQSVVGNSNQVNKPLSLIAQISQELVDSMSDIVWAINPNKDTLNDLSSRMRHFASDVLTARQIDFRFQTPDEEQDIKVGANVRREVFLMFKESVNNLVRHSRCTLAEIEFRIEVDHLYLQISDDGQGFDASQKSTGNGLQSMSERSKSLGGDFEIVSVPDQGTTLTFLIPLN
jgi:signal transduction histidine kinase/ligand-binding sensor domain-containing protein